MVLSSPELIEDALKKTKVADVWGIGRQYNLKLEKWQIFTAYDLSKQTVTWAHKNLGGVVGVRLLRELQGMPCITLKEALISKQMIATTRMFGYAVTDVKSIKEAVATYTARAAEKLRRQHCVAAQIEVFLIAKEPVNEPRFRHGAAISAHMLLPWPTAATNELIRQAAAIAEQLFEEGRVYKKAGVVLSKLTPETGIQQNMFAQSLLKNSQQLMETIDNINFSMRNDMVKFGTAGTTRNWKMQQNFHSPRYTTRWNELYEIS
jgi:DNA polymerase V